MANCCSVDHYILASDNAESRNELNEFAALLGAKRENPGEHRNPLWEALRTFYSEEELSGVCCRSSIEYVEKHENEVAVGEETAWCPMNEAWILLMQKFPLLEWHYVAEEFGCDLYETNDPDKVGQVLIDAHLPESICESDESYIYEIFEDKMGAKKYVERLLEERFSSFDDALKAMSDKIEAENNDDLYFSVHVCDFTEC